MSGRRAAGAIGIGIVGLFSAVLFLWPGPRTGPEPIQYGRDACADCRMPVAQPGFGGEMRDRDGVLTKYDDVGCLVRAMFAAHHEVPEVWVEDHEGGGFVPLLTAHLVHAPGVNTPMGHGLVAFEDATVASRYAAEHDGRVLGFEDVLKNPTMVARSPTNVGDDPRGAP